MGGTPEVGQARPTDGSGRRGQRAKVRGGGETGVAEGHLGPARLDVLGLQPGQVGRLAFLAEGGEVIGGRLDDLHALFLEERQVVLLLGGDRLAVQPGGFGGGVEQGLARLRREAGEQIAVGHQELVGVLDVGQGQVLLHLVEAAEDDVGGRVHLAVGDAGAQAHVQLGPGDRRAGGAEGFVERHLAGIHGAEAQALEVRRAVDRLLAVGEVEEAAFLDHRQQLGAGALAEGLAGGLPVAAAIEEGMGRSGVLEHEGRGADVDLREQRGDPGERGDVQAGAGHHLFHALLLFAEHAVGVELELQLAAALSSARRLRLLANRCTRFFSLSAAPL